NKGCGEYHRLKDCKLPITCKRCDQNHSFHVCSDYRGILVLYDEYIKEPVLAPPSPAPSRPPSRPSTTSSTPAITPSPSRPSSPVPQTASDISVLMAMIKQLVESNKQ